MWRIAMASVLGLSAGGGARAGDFSGFYAGVDAGYGWNRDVGRGAGTAPPGLSPPPVLARPETGLPPSAAEAAAAMRRRGGVAGRDADIR